MNALARSVALDYVERATLAEMQGHSIAAERLFVRAIEADRSLIDGYLGLAKIQAARGRSIDAMRTLDLAAQSALNDDESIGRWGRAMAAIGAADEAIRSIEARANSARSHRLIAELLVATGRIPEALAHARRAIEYLEATHADPNAQRDARRFARALSLLSGELDAVRSPGAQSTVLRRLLAR
jgi:tetratricopeptide (TPR) repeat protein